MKNSKNIYRNLTFFGVLISVNTAFAVETIPVSDANLQSTAEQTYSVLNTKIYGAINQSTSATQSMNRSIQGSLTGTNGTGLRNNALEEQSFRNWTPSSQDLINMVQQGLQTGSLADQIAYYNSKFKVPSAQQLNPGNPDAPTANLGVFSAVATNAAFSVADKSFDNVAQIQQQINYLYLQLDKQNTLKQSQDFNSVILLKIAALQTDLLRLQSQQLKMQAVSQEENNTKRMTMSQFIQDIK